MSLPSQYRMPMRMVTGLGVGVLVGLTLLLSACGTSTVAAGTPTAVPCPSTTSLSGAGSTFDNPLFTKMFTAYANATCNVQVTYNSVGSGAGVAQLLAETKSMSCSPACLSWGLETSDEGGSNASGGLEAIGSLSCVVKDAYPDDCRVRHAV